MIKKLQNNELSILDLSYSNISNKQLQAISDIVGDSGKLKKISLKGNHLNDDINYFMQSIGKLKLIELDISNNKLSDRSV